MRTGAVAALAIGALGAAAGLYIHGAPQRAEAAYQAGMRLAAAGETAIAADDFTRSIRIWPRSAKAYLERGLARRILLQGDAALADFDRALKLNPKLAAAHVGRGAIFRDRGETGRALEEFGAAIAVEPGVDSYYQRGQVYEMLGQHEKAIQDYDAAIALRPSAPFVYRARATAEFNLGDRAGAARDRQRAGEMERPPGEPAQTTELRP